MRYLLMGLLLLGGSTSIAAKPPQLPATPKEPVSDQYHGVTVTEDYRWLEDFSDPKVRQWSAAENAYARAYLDSLPDRPAIEKRLTELYSNVSADYYSLRYRNAILFAIKYQPPKEQPYLITLRSVDDPSSERAVVDPNQIDSRGTTAIDFYEPSLDGRLVAVSLSHGGSEKGTLHVYNVADGSELADTVPRVNNPTAGGSVAWNADGSGFYYTRYPRQGERPDADLDFYQQVYFHKIGTPTEQDVYSIGKEFPKIAEIELQTSPDGRYILAKVSNGDGGEYAHYILDPSGHWIQVTQFSDQITSAKFGPDSALYMLSHKDAHRGRILRLPLSMPELDKATIVVGPSEAVIQGFEPTPSLLYVSDLKDAVGQVRVFDHQGNLQKMVPVMAVSSVGQIVRLSGDAVLYANESYTEPNAWYRFDPQTDKATITALQVKSPVDFSDIEVLHVFAISKDGTRVPMTILMRQGTKLDGRNPALLTGYGGYGISQTPDFSFTRRIWFDQGGIYAVANIRGGGEYGEDWHLAGNLTHKQNDYDDFIACAQYLIARNFTSPAHLAIEGGSNGGLLMGAALTQRPDLFRAVVAHSGLYDMLRVELAPNGAFNVTEFGTVKDPEQFKALYAYSPYHHVVDSTAYPAVMFMTGDNDGRVDPANSRKMTARLQAATSSGYPILLRTSSSVGHGIGSGLSEVIGERADVYAFLFDQLRIKYKAETTKEKAP
jgi:prolyl oligopeptidase